MPHNKRGQRVETNKKTQKKKKPLNKPKMPSREKGY